MADEAQVVKSYHTFAFPFIWEKSGLSMEDISDSFIQNVYWCCDDFKDEWELPEQRAATQEERELLYAEYQYFYPAVRYTLYGIGAPPASHRFTFRPAGQAGSYNRNAGMEYIIECKAGNYECKAKNYCLNLNGIRLRLYNTGVGILVFECENTKYTTLADVKAINEYGRRVGVAAVPTFANAKKLGVCVGRWMNFITEFNFQPEDIGGKLPTTYFADFLTKLLNLGRKKHQFVSHQTKNRNEVFIYPAIDDRMFTHCMVQLKEPCADELFSYFRDPEAAAQEVEQSLYELFYVDTEENCSAQNQGMRREELRRSAYLRWLDYGTLHAVTHHSMFMLIKDGPPYAIGHVINAFLTEYFELACLCLAQKASLISLQAKMTEISSGLGAGKKNLKMTKINQLSSLQERFVAFSNQLDFYSVTEQYQGVELYHMLREQLYIHEARENLCQQIEALYETANVNQDFKFNMYAFAFALVALLWALASTWLDGLDLLEALQNGVTTAYGIVTVIIAALAVIVGAGTWLIFKHTRRKKKR